MGRAYIIAELQVADQAEFDSYDEDVSAVIAHYGGRFIVRGGDPETMEGNWEPRRIVMVEFHDMATLKRFYSSDRYAPLLARRLRASRAKIIAVSGVD